MRRVSFFFLIVLFLFPLSSIYGATLERSNIKIVIDPGHGGKDPGAIGVNGLYEKDVNLDISLRLRNLLEAEGYQVIMTRETDRSLIDYRNSREKVAELQARVDVATHEDADLFISIHSNSFTSKTQGTMVLYYDPNNHDPAYTASLHMKLWTSESKKIATSIVDSISGRVGTKNLGAIPSNVYVVRSGTVPSVLVEVAFLSNVEEAARLKDPQFRQEVAEAIRDGIIDYQPVPYVDILKHWAKHEIQFLSVQGIISGYKDRFFRPDQELTRAELVTLLENGIGFSGPNAGDSRDHNVDVDKQSTLNFSDLSTNHWAFPTIVRAYESGIIKGYSDGTFRPDQRVSREEMAEILFRTYIAQEDSLESKDDSDIDDALDSLENDLIVEDIIEEVEELEKDETHDLVDESTTDNETHVEVIENTSKIIFSDVPDNHWADEAISSLSGIGIIKGVGQDRFGLGRSVSRGEAAALLYRMLTIEHDNLKSLVLRTNTTF